MTPALRVERHLSNGWILNYRSRDETEQNHTLETCALTSTRFADEFSSGQSDRGAASSAQWAGETFVAYVLLELGRTKRVSSALTFRFVPLHPSALCHARPTRNDLRVCRVVCINHSEERACARKDDVRLANAEVVFRSN